MKYFGLIIAAAFLASCSDSKSNATSASIGAAVGGLFSSSGQQAKAKNVENSTCGEFEGEPGAGEGNPEGVSVTASIADGEYGADGKSVTVTAAQDCETAPSDANSFASFTMTADVVGDCSSGNVTMKAGSGGIFRNTATHTPEIYGTFTVEAGGVTYENVKCTMRMKEDGTVDADESKCTNSDDVAISMDSDETCTFGN